MNRNHIQDTLKIIYDQVFNEGRADLYLDLVAGPYIQHNSLIIPAGKSDARFVGHRPGTEVRWQANRHLWFQADYGIFYAGKFVKESQPGRNLNYWALWAGYKF